MLRWALGFFIVAIIAAIFGFGGIAAGAASIAKNPVFYFHCDVCTHIDIRKSGLWQIAA
jgi:Small integral membrane protein